MGVEEIIFPRGGKKSKGAGDKDEEADKLTPGSATGKENEKTKAKGIKGKKQTKKRDREVNADESPFDQQPSKKLKKEKVFVDRPLQDDDLTVGIVVLSCVRQVHPHSISVSLPGNRSAIIPLANVSDAYLELLNQTMDDGTEIVSPLTDLFKPGMFIPVVIKSIEENKGKAYKKITCSCNPAAINGGVPKSGLSNGMLLFGNVSSVEDHGYRIDSGIKGLVAFLKKSDAELYIQQNCSGDQLSVGAPLWFVVSVTDKKGAGSSENRVVNVIVDPSAVEKSKVPPKTQLNSLVPGMKMVAHVKSIAEQGILVTFGAFEGSIHCSHLMNDVKNYLPGTSISAAVLYVHPESKMIQLTLLENVVQQNGCAQDAFAGVEVGDKMEARILRKVKRLGLYVKLPLKRKGFAALSQLTDESDVPDMNNFIVGSMVNCRVMGLNHMESLVLVTMKKSVLEQQFITVKTLKPGDFVEGHIAGVFERGVSVKLSKGMYSFIQAMHMTNVPIQNLSKKFEPGMEIRCRVMEVDTENSRVALTHKPGLMKKKNITPTDYSKIEPQTVLVGVITVIKDNFLIVRFFNGVQGIVASHEMGLDKEQTPDQSFYKGQVVRCRVLHVNEGREKLRLSFNLTPQENEEDKKPKVVQEPVEISPGIITKAKIVAVKSNSYKVALIPEKTTAFLPFEHLSDYADIQSLRKLLLTKGDILPKVTFFTQKNQCIVTMKESLLRGAEEHSYVNQFEDLEVGMIQPAVIKNHQEYGFFVELIGGHTGLCPLKTASEDWKEHYPEGKSVITRIVKIDKEKARFLGGVSKADCVKDGYTDQMASLEEYVKLRQDVLKDITEKDTNLKGYGENAIGSVVKATVTSVYKKGALCQLSSGVKALVTNDHLGGIKPQTGKTYDAVVLDMDVFAPTLEISLDVKMTKAIQSRVENNSSQVKAGQTMKAELLLIKPEYLLMKLKGHGLGKLIYVPQKEHFNDAYKPSEHKIGMYSDVIVKRIGSDGTLMGVLKIKGSKASKGNSSEEIDTRNLPLHDIQVGAVIETKVKTVFPLQMNVTAGHIQGRVHITEVSDDDNLIKNPLHAYHSGDTVKVRVIGLRTMKSYSSYLPITQSRASRTLLECTIKPSKMEMADVTNLMSVDDLTVVVGASLTVFVIKVDDTKLWVQTSLAHQGFVSMFRVSTKVNIINDINKHFKVGQALKATVIGKTDNEKINFSLIGEDEVPEVGKEATVLVTGRKTEQLSVRLSNGAIGIIKAPAKSFSIGTYVKCTLLSISKAGVYKMCLTQDGKSRKRKSSATEEEEDDVEEEKERKDCVSSSEEEQPIPSVPKNKKSKKSKELDVHDKQVVEADTILKQTNTNLSNSSNSNKTDDDSNNNRLTIEGFAWGGDLNVKQTKLNEFAADDDDDDGDDVSGAANSKSKKRRKREQEKMIEDYEKQQLEGRTGPQNVNDFERLVIQSPNSSMVWLSFMAYHLELGEVSKARAVAEKALSTIVFREEQEKKNVWLAYLNLEAMYGDNEDLKSLLQRAVTYNDPLEIHLKMCDIFAGASKLEEAEQQYALLMKKFKKEKSVWKSYGQFLYKQDKQEAARNVLKRCLTALEKRDHVEVISRFANLEFSNGNPERGRTMFENLIASYPGRTDIWSVYVDMVVKSGDIAGARQLLQRAVKQKLNSKKLSFLIQKFVKFEEVHGTEEQIQKVKDMAVSLFES